MCCNKKLFLLAALCLALPLRVGAARAAASWEDLVEAGGGATVGESGMAPHYTRPQTFRGMGVPEVLVSGDHAAIEAWRHEAARAKTRRNRGDLVE